jgi:hypothetical protein
VLDFLKAKFLEDPAQLDAKTFTKAIQDHLGATVCRASVD